MAVAFDRPELLLRLAGRLPDRFEWCRAPNGVLVYQRGALTVACNFGHRQVSLELNGRLLAASHTLARHRQGRLSLPADSAAWIAS